jgi:hypothetical protein
VKNDVSCTPAERGKMPRLLSATETNSGIPFLAVGVVGTVAFDVYDCHLEMAGVLGDASD